LQDNSAGESAERTRRAINVMLQRGTSIGSVVGGLVAATDLQTTYAGSGLKVEVSPGEAIVPGNVSATQSGYYFRNTAADTITLAAANASNPRIERISAVVKDASYEGSENLGEIKVSEGTAKAGATLTNLEGVAAAPKNSLTLAYVLVPAAATTISNADIKNVAQLVGLAMPVLPLIPGNSGNITLAAMQAVEMATAGAVATTPAPTLNSECEIWCSASNCKVKAASGTINGDFVFAAGEVTLEQFQHIRLRADGANWLIVAGEPKREPTFIGLTETTFGVNHVLSASRPYLVTVSVEKTTVEGALEVTVRVASENWAYLLRPAAKVGEVLSTTFECPPGVPWIAVNFGGASAVLRYAAMSR
jgi:hypothetical protein